MTALATLLAFLLSPLVIRLRRWRVPKVPAVILTVLGAPFLGFATPFTAIQILWVNLLTDSAPALALSADPVDHDVMRIPPRDPTPF